MIEDDFAPLAAPRTNPIRVVPVTLERLAEAFEAWEIGFRCTPSQYLSHEECAAMDVSQVSAERAAYLLELLKEAT